jgi:DMSO/TMAO reductase YedYZ molybdopterin-dependent catalytic subunit
MELRQQLPNHPVPDEVRRRPVAGSIRVEGLVAKSVTLDAAALRNLRQVALEEPFVCDEGWAVPGLRWRGVALVDVLALAQPLEEAQFASICSGAYSVSIPLTDAPRILLCDMLNELPLPIEHGGPWRLIVPSGQCFTSVKWVERLDVTAERKAGTAEVIARKRLSSAH